MGLGSQLDALQNKEERIDIIPSFPACSSSKENCASTGCCQISGHKCFSKSRGVAQCNQTCTPGKQGFTCDVVGQPSVPVERELGQSLYCFSVYVKETGSSKVNTEPQLLALQSKLWASIFACEQWDVFSDVAVPIGQSGYVTVQVHDTHGEFHQVKRKSADGDGSWVNWGIFYQVWLKIREVGKWETTDYTVKEDPDAVFVPGRLRNYLASKKGDSPHGVYYENCNAEFAPCANDVCDWKYGAWGEDVFIQRCMDHHYVDKVEAFDVITDGACEADRPEGEKKKKKWHAEDCSQLTTVAAHRFKKTKEYLKCLGEMTGQQYSM